MYGKLHRFLTIYMQVSALLEIPVVKFDFEIRIYFDVKNKTNLGFIFFYVKISGILEININNDVNFTGLLTIMFGLVNVPCQKWIGVLWQILLKISK